MTDWKRVQTNLAKAAIRLDHVKGMVDEQNFHAEVNDIWDKVRELMAKAEERKKEAEK